VRIEHFCTKKQSARLEHPICMVPFSILDLAPVAQGAAQALGSGY
jgi:hypothetical protein